MVGLLALGWAKRTRAGVALAQGWFLAALGLGVIGSALARVLHAGVPEAELMGGLGVAGLLVNIAAAVALMRFRDSGDANAKAIWLFSRNDAIANVAVIIAAALVQWLKNALPDLVVAGVIAAHDRALRLLPKQHQLTGQLATMLVMVGYTFTGLYLLFGG